MKEKPAKRRVRLSVLLDRRCSAHRGSSAQEKIANFEGKKQSHRPGLYYVTTVSA